MCFSASADFAAAAVIGAVGVATLAQARAPRALPLAALPLLFAAHQLTEGFVWLGMDGRLGPQATREAALLFMLYAQGLLPMILAPAVALVEPDRRRRAAMWALAAVGLALGLWAAHGLTVAPSSVVVEGRCLAFRNPVTNHPWVAFTYALPTCGAPLLSSRPVVRLFGAGALLGFALVLAVKAYALTSVWCLVVAALSVGLYAQFRRGTFAPGAAAAA